MVDFLQNSPPAAIQISLYGAGEDTYEQVTGRRAFSLIMENVRRAKAAGLPLTIAVTPSAYMTDAEQILHLLDKEELPFAVNASILPPRPETRRGMADASLDTYIAVLRLRSQLKGRELFLEGDPESLLYPWAFMRHGKEQIILQPITPCRWSATTVLTMGYVCIV